MNRLIVTGSSGTVGTALCDRLLTDGRDVFCTDLNPNGFNAEVDRHTVRVDLTSRHEIGERFPESAEAIVHLAAYARVPHSLRDPSQARDNFEMTFNLLEYAREAGIKKILFSSSKDVYGNARERYAEEHVVLEACESPYAASKLGGEALFFSYSRCFGIDFVVARLSNVYGRYDPEDRMLPIFIRRTEANEDLTVNGADKLLDFVFIDDVVAGLLLCLEKFDTARNQVFNIASGEGTPLLRIAELVREYLGGTNAIHVENSKPGDVIRSISDVSKARRVLGFDPSTTIDEGVRLAVDEYRRK
jgi:UDP-glucose 4-epimerase